jgi:hypothetical protein
LQYILQLFNVVAVAIVNDGFGEPIVGDRVVLIVFQFGWEVVTVMLARSLLTSSMAG